MKHFTFVALMLLAMSAIAARKPSGGFRGVPWTGSREDFKRAIPGLSCAPFACHGEIEVGDIPTKVDLTWGRGGPDLSIVTMTFQRANAAEMKGILREKYGTPTRQYTEDGVPFMQWSLPDVTVELDQGSPGEDAVVSFEVKAAYRKFAEQDRSEKQRRDTEHKKSMRGAAKDF